MKKELYEMTLEELWHLFPIKLVQHQEEWKNWYFEEEKRLKSFLPHFDNVRINHIGSTAINGIWAKPIIDILVEIPLSLSMEEMKIALINNGYICMAEEKMRKDFNKGYTKEGFAERVFHLHLRYFDDNDEIYFKNYLNEFPTEARKYEELKLSLWKKYEYNRDGYTNAKHDYVKRITDIAKHRY